MLDAPEFEIELIVKFNGKTYTRKRTRVKESSTVPYAEANNGCNHIDNMPTTAEYLGNEIYNEILDDNPNITCIHNKRRR